MGLSDFINKLKKGQIKILNAEADFHNLKQLIKTGDIILKLFSGNTKTDNHFNIDNSKHLTINITQLDQGGKEQLKNLFHELKDEGFTLLEDKSTARLDEIVTEEQTDDSKKILGFFKDKISSQDLEIIRGALYVKNIFDKGGKNIDILKADMRHKYGQRGNNIVNLCSAKYFESYLIPYYEHLVTTETDKQEISKKFAGLFNLLAGELPFTVFVSHDMKVEEVVNQVVSKFEYGAEFVNIHGIGVHNVMTVKEAVEETRKEYGEENISINIEEAEKQVIKARIGFRRKSSAG